MSINHRQMPPPSSPQHHPSHSLGAGRGPPPPPPSHPYAGTRDSRPLPAAHRPGSSMSISSMLGSDSDRPHRDNPPPPLRPPSITSNQPPATTHNLSPRKHQQHDLPPFPRSRTPDRTPFGHTGPRPFRALSGGDPPINAATEPPRFGPPLHAQPSQSYPAPDLNGSQQSPRRGSLIDLNSTARRSSISGPLPRQDSDPERQTEAQRTPNIDGSQRGFGLGYARNGMDFLKQNSPKEPWSSDAQSKAYVDQRERALQERQEMEKKQAEEQNSGIQSTSRFGRGPYGQPDRDEERRRRDLWGIPRSQPGSPEARRDAPVTGTVSRGLGNGSVNRISRSPFASSNAPQEQLQERPSSTPQGLSRLGQTSSQSEQAILEERQRRMRQSIFSPFSGSNPVQQTPSQPVHDDTPMKPNEEPLHHRNILNVAADLRRAGRISPLPQAVQGAQAQYNGPGGESAIKSELGRVFSGIGSGVNISSTPPLGYTPAPLKRDDSGQKSFTADAAAASDKPTKPSRAGTGQGRRTKKVKEEENRIEKENDEGVGPTSAPAGRRGKGARATHQHAPQYVERI